MPDLYPVIYDMEKLISKWKILYKNTIKYRDIPSTSSIH